ncbi:Shedu anti-phage system protein SduA domain-containing protein [Leptotrichia hongkongensis]|uniref:Shedu anti-phage system protein SduA domain-containing protein n=1 Tax=Leptotrichia hongkongensis TaxID=554406 RepID=A0ABV4S820_9FUSO
MKKFDFIFDFGKPEPMKKGGVCWIRTYEAKDKSLITFITDLKENDGTSVINAIEVIIKKLILEREFKNHTFIEHREKDGTFSIQDDFSKVFIKNGIPVWETLETKKIEKLIGTTNFTDLTNDRSLMNKEVQKKITEITEPRKLAPLYLENDDFKERKLNIRKKMKSKKELIDLIEKKAKEQELLNFLKQDLSFFGEIYASLEDEFIVFSEFPIEEKDLKTEEVIEGHVDFVVFTGRSRMEVIFIEVKGANFNLYNQSGYKQQNANITKAQEQIHQRFKAAENQDFRNKCHKLREKAENGRNAECKYLVGAKGKLEVDPDKEIIIRSVIIGGRTRNDQEESLKRDSFEKASNYRIKLESWHSWIKKLKRGN